MKRILIYILLSISLIVLWQYFSNYSSSARLLISSPQLIYQYFKANYSILLLATGITLLESILGLTIATLFSFGMMIICFYNRKFMNFIMPIMITSQVIPLITLAPFFIILLGIGLPSKVAMSAVLCFFPIFVNFAQGYKLISTNIHELTKIYNASTWFKIKHIYFPLALPNIMAGLKISATLSVIGAIVAEFTGSENGLGKNLFLSAIRLEPDLMMTSLFLSAITGFLLFGTLLLIERKIGKWYEA